MTSEEIRNQVREFVLKEFLPGQSPETLTDSTELITGGLIDSIGTLKLISFLEETYDIEMAPHEMEPQNLNSVGEIAALVASKNS